MGQITVYAAVANAAARLPPGRERRLIEMASRILNYSAREDESYPLASEVGRYILDFEDDDSTQQIGPICPHCKREPCNAAGQLVQFGGIPVLQFTCGGCRKILGFSILPPPPVEDHKPEGRLASSGLVLPR
jgi:hypothetical protein